MKYYSLSKELDFKKFNSLVLSGFSYRTETERLGLNQLMINVCWFKLTDNEHFLIISMDLLYIPKRIAFQIYDFLFKKFNLSKNKIFFNASHTHSAPGVEEKFDKNINNEIVEYIVNEIKTLFCNVQFIECDIQLITLQTSQLHWISRRKIGRNIRKLFVTKETIMLPNANKAIDDKIRLILIYDTANIIKEMIINFSCHPVFNVNNEISSDFIGVITNNIEKELNIKCTYLQGFSGDIRPNITVKSYKNLTLIDKLKLFFNKEIFKKSDRSNFIKFCDSVTKDILNFKNINRVNSEDKVLELNSFDFELFSQTGNTSKTMTTKIIRFNNFLFVSIPAEVNSRYYVELSNRYPSFSVFPLGLAEDIIGYLPYYTECDEFGYEVNSSINYNWDSIIDKNSLKKYFDTLVNCLDQTITSKRLKCADI